MSGGISDPSPMNAQDKEIEFKRIEPESGVESSIQIDN